METIEGKLRDLFGHAFPSCELELDMRPDGRVGGFLVWNGFETVEDVDRLDMIWTSIRQSLSPEEQSSITSVFGFTQDEMEVMREEQEIAG